MICDRGQASADNTQSLGIYDAIYVITLTIWQHKKELKQLKYSYLHVSKLSNNTPQSSKHLVIVQNAVDTFCQRPLQENMLNKLFPF